MWPSLIVLQRDILFSKMALVSPWRNLTLVSLTTTPNWRSINHWNPHIIRDRASEQHSFSLGFSEFGFSLYSYSLNNTGAFFKMKSFFFFENRSIRKLIFVLNGRYYTYSGDLQQSHWFTDVHKTQRNLLSTFASQCQWRHQLASFLQTSPLG